MQIKIEAQDMLHVLVDAGLDSTDAKAIIFDLLQLPDAGPERKALLEARRSRKKIVLEKKMEEEEEEEEEEEDEDEDEDEVEPVAAVQNLSVKTTKVKKTKRVNFSSFGGAADPLRS